MLPNVFRKRLTALPKVVDKEYPANVAAVIRKIKQTGIPVQPYLVAQPSQKNQLRKSQTKVFVNGRLCAIQVRPRRKYRPDGRYYARFDIGRDSGAEALLLAIIGDPMKLYVVPRSHLRNVSSIYIPGDGRYHPETGKRPARDWTRYENAWHHLEARTNESSAASL